MFVPSLESWELSFSSVNRAGGGQKQKERESKYGLFEYSVAVHAKNSLTAKSQFGGGRHKYGCALKREETF